MVRKRYQLQTTELSLSKSYVHVTLVTTPNVIRKQRAYICHLMKHREMECFEVWMICKYTDNVSITDTLKQSISLFKDLPCASYLLEPIMTTSLPATENLHCIQETRTSTCMSMFQHTQISTASTVMKDASITSGSIFNEGNGPPLLNLDTVITHCHM
jgi:hypothetical protein